MMDYVSIHNALLGKVHEENIRMTDRATIRRLEGTKATADLIVERYKAMGYSQDRAESYVLPTMLYSVGHLCRDKHSYSKEAKFCVNAYVSTHQMDEPENLPTDYDGNGHGDDTPGDGEPTDGDNGLPQGDGQPDNDTDGDGDGDGNGDDNGDGQPGDGDGQPDEGEGQPSSDNNDGPTTEGDDEEMSGASQIPDDFEPPSNLAGLFSDNGGEAQEQEIPPEDMPNDPDYMPPSQWNLLLRILRFNNEHPGKAKNIMLVGMKGIGKTELVFQLADKVFNNKPYGITAPQQPYELTGFANALGKEIKSNFSKGYDQPGIILIDEIDRSSEETLIKLNMALANKQMDTPVRGLIEQHPQCTVIATANTSGTGATNDYNTAHQLDASTRDRFYYVLIEWDHRVAMKVAKGDGELVAGLEEWNKVCDDQEYTSGLVSYRTITDVLDAVEHFGVTFEEAIKSAMLKFAIEKSDLFRLYEGMRNKENKVARAIKHIYDKLPAKESMF